MASGFIIKRNEMCGAKGGPEGARCERRKGHEHAPVSEPNLHMGSPIRNGKRIATDVVEWESHDA